MPMVRDGQRVLVSRDGTVSLMSVSAAHARAFFQEAVAAGAVWSIADADGHPAPLNGDGRRSMLSGLEADELLVGLNWSGEVATGYDVEPADARRMLVVAEGDA